MRFHQIVVGIDFSPNCRQALREAVRLQRDAHTGVVAIHIVEKMLVADMVKHLETTEEDVRKQAEFRLQHWVGEIAGPDHTVSCEAVVAHPFDGVMNAVERHKADLLIVGSRGLVATPGHPGSTAAKCIRKTAVDVMLVRRQHEGAFSKVVACLDFSDTSARALELALAIATAEGAACDALHVHMPLALNDLALDPFPPSDSLRLNEVRETEARKDFDAFLAAHTPPDWIGKLTPVFRSAASATDGIVSYLKETNADLTVLGTRGRSGLRVLLLGTTAERLVNDAPCSVLVAKPPKK